MHEVWADGDNGGTFCAPLGAPPARLGPPGRNPDDHLRHGTHRSDRQPGGGATPPASRLKGWDSLEFYVGNARATAGFLTAAFGFRVTAYAGPETGRDDIASYLLEQGDIRFVVTAGLTPDSPIWTHVREHGDGAQDLAFVVDDATATYEAAIARGATLGARALRVDRRTRHPAPRRHRHLRRDEAHLRRPPRLSRLLLPRLRHHRAAAGAGRLAGRDWSGSTTSSATSRPASSTSGWRSTRTSWGSVSCVTSTSTRSPPSTARCARRW